MTLQPGTRIGPYEVVAPLGAGGMGEVYRAHDVRLNRDVALKTLPQAFVADPERMARFEREARMLATLNHPNIATIHGLERQDGLLALAMELVDGDTLDERLRRDALPGRGLPVRTALLVARQLVEALDAAHEKGVVHRDLKPANIKLTPDGIVKVLDFGLAKAMDVGRDFSPAREGAPEGAPYVPPSQLPTITSPALMTGAGVILGTAAYMSPEQARGQAVDGRADIWAFGCVLYEMLSGRKTFARDTVSDTIAAVLEHEVDWTVLPADVPPSVRKLVTRCLERNPKARLRDIGDALSDLADDAPTASVPAPTVTADGGRVSRRHLLTGSAAIGLLGAAFGGGVLATRGGGAAATPSFQRLTFRRGMIRTARFGPDFQTVLYGALWDGDVCRVYTVRPESPESSPLALPPGTPLAISANAEVALALGAHFRGIMTYGTLARVPLAGGAPREVLENVKFADWSPDGRELAVVRRVGVRDQLEFPIGTVLAEARSATGGFSFPRVSPTGDAVAAFELDAADALTGRVVVVTRTGATRVVSATYANVFGLAWKGDDVWFAAADELPLLRNTIHALGPTGVVRVVARVPGNTTLHDIAPDGRVLIARTDDRGGISVRAPGESVERDLSWLDASSNANLSRDGAQLLFSETGVGGGPRSSTYLRGTDGSPAVRLGDGSAQALSPDGRWAIVRSGGPHFELIPTGAGQARRIERAGLNLQNAQWLVDGRRLVVRAATGDRVSRLYVTDIDGDAITPLTPEDMPIPLTGWAPSPDGSMVAVSTTKGPTLFPVDGGPSRQLPGTNVQWSVAGWIDAGVLVLDDPQSGTVYRVDPVTGRRETWAEIRPRDPAGIMFLDLPGLRPTPDGRAYAYTWHRAISDLHLVRGWV